MICFVLVAISMFPGFERGPPLLHEFSFVGRLTKDGPRREDWQQVFGGDVVPLLSPTAARIGLPNGSEAYAYFLNVGVLTIEQRGRLVRHLAVRFEMPADEVESDIDFTGVPVLIEDIVVSVPYRFYS